MSNEDTNGIRWFVAGIFAWLIFQATVFALAVTYVRAVFGSTMLGTCAAVAFALNMHRPLSAGFGNGSDFKFGIRCSTIGISNLTRLVIAAWIVQMSLNVSP